MRLANGASPVPVDPWGPLIARQAREARDLMLKGMRTLQDLGKSVVTKQTAEAKKVPPAVDEEAQGEGNEGRKATTKAGKKPVKDEAKGKAKKQKK